MKGLCIYLCRFTLTISGKVLISTNVAWLSSPNPTFEKTSLVVSVVDSKVCFKKKKEDRGVLFLDDIITCLYTIEAPSLRTGRPPLDLPSTKDLSRFYTLTSDGQLDIRRTTKSLNSQAEIFFTRFTRVRVAPWNK